MMTKNIPLYISISNNKIETKSKKISIKLYYYNQKMEILQFTPPTFKKNKRIK